MEEMQLGPNGWDVIVDCCLQHAEWPSCSPCSLPEGCQGALAIRCCCVAVLVPQAAAFTLQ